MQWLPTRSYGSLSVYSRLLPSEKIAPFAAQLKIAFRRFLFIMNIPAQFSVISSVPWEALGFFPKELNAFKESSVEKKQTKQSITLNV